MTKNLVCWGTAIGAFARILEFQSRMRKVDTYFNRLRMANDALGPNWVFRLVDLVGLDTIIKNRPSWAQFYVDDHDGLHAPLDPGAPETEKYLGTPYSIKDMAFYAGMGFDGYRLALQTQRSVNSKNGTIDFDGRYQLADESIASMCAERQKSGTVEKPFYYRLYAEALDALYDNFEHIRSSNGQIELIERTAGASLILLCGGHTGCLKHKNQEEEFKSQLESIIIFSFARLLANGEITLKGAEKTLQVAA